MRILVVDDVGYSRHHLSLQLKKLGHQVESIESGAEALKILERDLQISVVFTDLMMPHMDGTELYKQSLRINRLVDDGSAKPPQFVLTALRPESSNYQQKYQEQIRMAKLIGFADVLFKPIEADKLKSTLNLIEFVQPENPVDTSGAVQMTRETTDRVIDRNLAHLAADFRQKLQSQCDRLSEFLNSNSPK